MGSSVMDTAWLTDSTPSAMWMSKKLPGPTGWGCTKERILHLGFIGKATGCANVASHKNPQTHKITIVLRT